MAAAEPGSQPPPSHSERDRKRRETWKAAGEPVGVVLVSRENTRSESVVYRRDLAHPERIVRALVGLSVCWLLAAVSVLVPIAHFVLVPGFLIAGPIAAWSRYKGTSIVLGGLAHCPRCHSPMRIKKSTEDWPISAACDECRAIVQVERVSGGLARPPLSG